LHGRSTRHPAMYLLPMLVSEYTNMAHIDLAARSNPCACYLECISWRIHKPLTDCEVYDCLQTADERHPLTKQQLRTVVLQAEPCSTCGCRSAIPVRLPVHRHPLTDDLFETITFAGPTRGCLGTLKGTAPELFLSSPGFHCKYYIQASLSCCPDGTLEDSRASKEVSKPFSLPRWDP
jgi:hypothetical protein